MTPDWTEKEVNATVRSTTARALQYLTDCYNHVAAIENPPIKLVTKTGKFTEAGRTLVGMLALSKDAVCARVQQNIGNVVDMNRENISRAQKRLASVGIITSLGYRDVGKPTQIKGTARSWQKRIHVYRINVAMIASRIVSSKK